LNRLLSLILIAILLSAAIPFIAAPFPVEAANDWVSVPSGSIEHLAVVWAASCTDVFAVGGAGAITHYNGSTWSAMTSNTPYPLYSVWGSSGNDVFATGGTAGNSRIMHYNGSAWSAMTQGAVQQFIHSGVKHIKSRRLAVARGHGIIYPLLRTQLWRKR